MRNSEKTGVNKLSNVVIVKGDVLHSGVKNWIGAEVCGTYIVTLDNRLSG